MRALHLVKTSVGATWALRQMRELVKLGVEVHVALPPGGPLVPAYQAAGVVVHPLQLDLPTRAPWKFPHVFGQLRELVQYVDPTIIHSHFVGTTLTARLALGKGHATPRVFQVPGPLHLEHRFFKQAEIATAGPQDYWIGSCQWTGACYRASGIASDRVFLSYYGTDIDTFTPCQSGTLRAELGLAASTSIIGMVAFMYAPKRFLGQTRGIKGHEDLIDAIAICQESDPDIVGVFIGGAWNNATAYEQRVQAYAEQRLGRRAVFLGSRGDVPDLYPDLAVVVHPSHSENVGGAGESLLLGIPTIATNVGGFPDVVKHGETGWLVAPRAPKQIASAILEALHNPRRARAMASAGRDLTRQLFDIRQCAREVADIYETITSHVCDEAIVRDSRSQAETSSSTTVETR